MWLRPASRAAARSCAACCGRGEAVAPLVGPLSKQSEVVILADQIRQLVGPPGDALHLPRRGAPHDLRRVPQVLCALAQLVQVLGVGLLAGGAVHAAAAPVDPPKARSQRVQAFPIQTPVRNVRPR
jgi:hypothetical protein